MASNTFTPQGVGSTDWAGGHALAGGTHTGTAVVTMTDGTQYTVAHNSAEVRRKLDLHAIPPPSSALVPWVAFDQPLTAVPIILNAANVATVT